MRRSSALAAGLCCVVANVAGAATVFSDSFDTYVGADSVLNWNGAPVWSVASGTVDLIQHTDFGIGCHNASAGCVDLDGSTDNAGILSTVSSNLFSVTAGQTYTLSAWLSGSQRTFGPPDNPLNDPNEIEFGFKTGSNVTQAALHVGPLGIDSPFTLYTLTYTPTQNQTLKLFFSSLSGSDDSVGAILDDVSLSTVPLPAALPLLLSAIGALGALGRRRLRQPPAQRTDASHCLTAV